MSLFRCIRKHHMTDQEMLRREAEQFDVVRSAAVQFARAVSSTDLILRWEDGNGGAYLNAIRQALAEAGLIDHPKSRKKSSRRSAAISQHKRKMVYERNQYRCVTCGSFKDLSVDHIIPASRGGSDDIDNLQTMCIPCNTKKGARE
jgi:predicted restriction endonuclease